MDYEKLIRFNDAFLFKCHPPRLKQNYKAQVIPHVNFLILDEVPDESHRVIIKGFNEVKCLENIINKNDFFVDYSGHHVYFHPSQAGKEITINSYYGIGVSFVGANRIVTKTSAELDIIETLQDLLDKYETIGNISEIKELINTLNIQIKEVNDILDSGLMSKNSKYIINSSSWLTDSDSTHLGYKYVINHNLNKENLGGITVWGIKNNMTYPPVFKYVDNNNLEMYSDEKLDFKVVINA